MTSRTGSDELVPFAYAYRYPTFPPAGATVIRFGTNGREINGAKPIETIPLYRRAIATPDTDRVAVLTEELQHFIDIIDGTDKTGFDPHVEQMLMDAAETSRAALSQPLGSQER